MLTDAQISNLKDYLGRYNAEVTVTFTKADATDRVMRCTTNGALIPEDMWPKGTATNLSKDVQRAFDLDLQEWRSFRFDAVKSFTVSDKHDQQPSS